MLNGRDRLLAGLFALQLLAAAAFGLVLVNGTNDAGGTEVVTSAAGPEAAPVAEPSAGPAAATDGAAAAATVAKGAPIKIGAIVSQTGAIDFAASAQGTKAYLDRVNRSGGINGHKIVLDLRDDQLDAARGRQQAQQLLADGVFAFAGWNAPLTEQDIVPLLEQNKIPLIGGYGTRPEYKSGSPSPWGPPRSTPSSTTGGA